MKKINIIMKDNTLGFDIGSLLSNPLVSTGMNAVLPGSSMALPFLSQAMSSPQKSTSMSRPLTKPVSILPPPPRISSTPTRSPSPPPPRPMTQSLVGTRQFQVSQPTNTTQTPKQGLDKNVMLIGGITLAGIGIYILTNNKGKRR